MVHPWFLSQKTFPPTSTYIFNRQNNFSIIHTFITFLLCYLLFWVRSRWLGFIEMNVKRHKVKEKKIKRKEEKKEGKFFLHYIEQRT